MKSRLMFVKLDGMDRVIKDVSNLDFKIKKIKSLVLLSNSKRKIFSRMKGYKIVDNNDTVIVPHPLFSCGTHNVLKFKEDDVLDYIYRCSRPELVGFLPFEE